MKQRFAEPRGTVRIHTTAGRFALLPFDMASADGTLGGHAEGLAFISFRDDADDFGNYIAAAFQQDGVSNGHVQARDLVLVVERGARDGNAADHYRFQMSNRR